MAGKNILIFMTDGHRADTLGCYGNPILKTPNVDALAREGVRFTRAFCPHTVCMPTRATVFTGRYPHTHGVRANGIPLPKGEVTLPQVLAGNGYRTGAAGKLHFEPQAAPEYPPKLEDGRPYYGFHEVRLSENKLGAEYLRFIDERFPELARAVRRREPVPEEAHPAHWVTGRAIDFIKRCSVALVAGNQCHTPFFCFCSFDELIPPCHVPTTFADLYKPEDMPAPKMREGELDTKPPYYRQCYEGYVRLKRQPDDATLRKYLASYYNQAAFLDKQFGRVVSALKECGVWDETIVLFTTDHGLLLNDHWQWRHGPFLQDPVINIPMIWRVPGRGGRVVEELVETVDIMPTLLDLVSADVGAHGRAPLHTSGIQGRSLRPLLLGEAGTKGKECILAEDTESPELRARGLDPAGFRIKAVRTRDWKLIHYPGAPYGELYDLRNDPDEFENLWSAPRYGEKRREMEKLLLDRLCDSEDPLPQMVYEW